MSGEGTFVAVSYVPRLFDIDVKGNTCYLCNFFLVLRYASLLTISTSRSAGETQCIVITSRLITVKLNFTFKCHRDYIIG